MEYTSLIGTLMTFSWTGFFHCLRWSGEFLVVWPLWLVTLALIANLVAALVTKWPFRQDRWKKSYWLVFTNLLFIPVTIAIGVAWELDTSIVPRPKPNPLAVWTSNGSFFVSIALGVYWAFRMKGLRWVAIAILLVTHWMLMGAGVIAGMSLSGDWL
jgi:hypothetical protein